MTPQSQPAASFPIVGIGASAGGLAAFEAFFSGMPPDRDPGMAFVLVQHLSPDHESLLAELIGRCTRMPVHTVEDGMVVKPNCIYIIPPNRDMALLNGSLQLLEPAEARGHHLPVDFFFKSLAADQQERAIGIVLSGTASDGTLGVRAIKGAGGMVMAQSPATGEFDGMPRSAIATGLVDYQLPPAEMPAQLMAYVARALARSAGRPEAVVSPKLDDDVKKVFVLLRAKTGHDFSQYKPSTIHRRIDRRMAVQQIETFDRYVKFLQKTPSEVEALFRDLLIGVTNFFRDPEAFQALEELVIPKLFEGKPAGAKVRVWSTGCSTGEEAYSLAILLVERMETLRQNYTLQVFATDIDSRAIATARAGVYPASVAADVSPERLARFFVAEPGGQTYRIHKSIRDLLVFSEQDLIKDPPFSKLDLISCRNLLIYLDANLQKRVVPLFHYALKPGGLLFLGTSEGVGEFDTLFSVVDRKAKLYARREDLPGAYRAAQRSFITPVGALDGLPPLEGVSKSALVPAKQPLRELTEQAILRQIAPASALVNARGDILYLHGRTGMYLEPSPGEVGVQNILKMAREGLRPSLSTVLHQVATTHHPAYAPHLSVKTNGHFTPVNLSVHPVLTPASQPDATPLYLVMLDDVPAWEQVPEAAPAGAKKATRKVADKAPAVTPLVAEARIQALTQELRAKDEYLQSAQEELESSNEELKSSNEEMQSVNEELQSSNEELETSKEELQSVNEELSTVNAELQIKVGDLSHANDDMNNLLAGTGIGTLFVDHRLRIMRFTPPVSDIIHLIATDVGRPVTHFMAHLASYTTLEADVKTVLKTLAHKQVEVQAPNGNWYNLRIQPYRTLNNVIEGAVITFADITDLKHSEESLRNAADGLRRMAVVLNDAFDAITVQDLEGRTLAWNPGAVRLYGWTEAQALRLNVRERIPEGLRDSAMVDLLRLSRAEVLQPLRTQRLTQSGAVVDVSVISTALRNAAGEMYAVATTERAKT